MNEWTRWMRHSLGAGCAALGMLIATFVWWDELGLGNSPAILGPAHVANWYFGWCLLGLAFLTGAAIGLAFFQEDFWGGYSSFQRRVIRLGHVSLATMGLVNVLYGVSPWPTPYSASASMAGLLFVLGGITLPGVFFLAGWRPGFRLGLCVPALLLCLAIFFTVRGGNEADQPISDPSADFLNDDSTQFRSLFYNPDLFKALPHPKDTKSKPEE